MQRLDPKLDVVFKLLFVRHPELLRPMLEAVLEHRVAEFTILNPEIPGELSVDRSVVLDVRVVLASGERVDVEMQVTAEPALPARLVCYAARDYADQLRRGDTFAELTATVVIAWLVEPLKPLGPRFHSVFELRERSTGQLFSDQLCFHVLQLAHLSAGDLPASPPAPAETSISTPSAQATRRWARFLVAQSDAELEALAQEDPIMQSAKQALEELSQDPLAARLARERADSLKLYEMSLLRAAREGRAQGKAEGKAEGRAEGKAEGKAQGKAEGKAETVLTVLAARGLLVSESTRALIKAQTDLITLERWVVRALTAASAEELLAS
jgi:predicted transposase/invertase (TIGR01784 family)